MEDLEDMNKKKVPRLSKAKVIALSLIKKEPHATKMEIGRKLMDLGLVTRPDQIYNLTRADRDNGYIDGEISEIKKRNLEMMSREIVPEALKIHKKVLQDKTIPDKKKKDWVQMAEKAEFQFDETKRPPSQPQTVNILAIQQMIYNDMTKEDDEVIDVISLNDNFIEEKAEDV